MTEPTTRGVLLHVLLDEDPGRNMIANLSASDERQQTFGVFDDEADAGVWASAHAREIGFSSWSYSYVQMVKGQGGIIPVPVKGYCPDKGQTLAFDSREEAEHSDFMRVDCWQRHVLTEISPEEAAQLRAQ